jgi:hypothetical protein
MDIGEDDLLQPSLRPEAPATAIYSATTGYMASVFGGPIAGAVIALLNARRLDRLGRDWWVGLVAVAIMAVVMGWIYAFGGEAWLDDKVGTRGPRFAIMISGLVFFAGIYALHRPSYRGMEHLGIKPPSGWLPGILAIAIGIAVSIVIATAIEMASSAA